MISGTLPTPRIIVLAAGFSSRLGRPKALARVHGASLLDRTLSVLAPFSTSSILVVVPPRPGRYRIGRWAGRVTLLVNPLRARGLSTSVKRGIGHARYSAAVLLLPVDLVELRRRDVARLIARWRGARRRVSARRMGTEPATPLILPRARYEEALGISGDQGLRDWVRRLPKDQVSLVAMPSAAADVDTAADLEAARRRHAPPYPQLSRICSSR